MRFEIQNKTAYYGNGSGASVDGQPIVFVHGAGFDHTVWVLPARYFARKGYRVVALDLPGHGRSEGPALTSVEAVSDWISEVSEKLELKDIVVVGHSMGSLIAYCLAAQNPDLVTKMVL